MTQNILAMIAILVLLIAGGIFLYMDTPPGSTITNFEECAAAGNPIMESYPRQCRTPEGAMFTEDVGNELEKTNLIRVENPRPNQKIQSPLSISGAARGYWFFEASFPIKLLDANGKEVAVAIAQADGEWMTEDFVPFKATLTFTSPGGNMGTLLFQKDNPSGLPEHDNALIVPVIFAEPEENDVIFCTQDAKLCPDGSYVGRMGSKCEFRACPEAPRKSGVSGVVLLGPTCPVVKNPPEETCADKPYAVKIEIANTDDSQVLKEISSGADGIFKTDLPPGEYDLHPVAPQGILPHCSDISATILSGAYTETTIYCDTGIR